MAEQLFFDPAAPKQDKYAELIPQIEALISYEDDVTANLANVAAALRQAMGFFWVGFYIARTPDMLVLGPFQGPIACTRIPKGRGVCGAAFERAETILVPDVEAFSGHIACSSDSKSEIVLPAFKEGKVALVLDVDSNQLNDFDEVDQQYLEQLMRILEKCL
ncbi:GAF domain-containing protein [Endozoicomonas gorgoniicola]|uniref:GAF domain-containing protein n=1 Tax=Endozoicomonas gorgoniicola TaxID=1234144 RepID=A0ABT3MSW7_9GAMM|nr:GAF domain-containing protein [Endozoicomonas gorgoniicola]MCW7552466.1 GAF domain-containing protein [Endozoicomonas gorgoniicola]